jgi:adenosylcobyric acid synthase
LEQHAAGAAVWGICGGYQMLGRVIRDPHGVESSTGEIEGLGLLPVETTLLSEKTTRAVTARTSIGMAAFGAYEIHMGETTPPTGDSPFAWIEGRGEGFRKDGIIGTYLHGALESPDLLGELLTDLARQRGKPAPTLPAARPKDADYDRLADWFEQHADLARFEELYLS